jgi:hypothetical protein
MSKMRPAALDALLSRRILFTTEQLNTNGFSNRVQTSQTIVYMARTFNLSVAMMPFQPAHNDILVAPWSKIVNLSTFMSRFPNVIPPSILPIIMPRVIFEFFDTAQLALTNVSSDASLGLFPNTFANILKHSRVGKHPYAVIGVAKNAVLHEEAVLNGSFSFKAKHPYLGFEDSELPQLMEYVSPLADVALPRAFRAFKFSRTHDNHVAFAEKWHSAFKPSSSVVAKVDAAKAALAAVPSTTDNYACAHVRLRDEYVSQHTTYVHGNVSAALLRLKDFVNDTPGAIYVASDIDLREWMAKEVPVRKGRSKRVFTCFDFGCKLSSFNDALHGYIDANLCASASTFKGNTFSSFTQQICALRGSQACEDLFGRKYGDGRYIFG